MRIAIVVHGRFHAFHLARALSERGHDVVLLTNYPRFVAARFGVPRKRVRSFLVHGLIVRAAHRLGVYGLCEPVLHRLFSNWAAHSIKRDKAFDVVYAFSGVAEELFDMLGIGSTLKLLVRGSSHIVSQKELLEAEERRAGIAIEKPSAWIVAREMREYKKADRIVVLSTFALRTFREQGFADERLWLLRPGAQFLRFHPAPMVDRARQERIRSGAPLRVLYTGTMTFRKGGIDLLEMVSRTHGRFVFRFVGTVDPAFVPFIRRAALSAGAVEWVARQPEFDLPRFYDWADLFCFPTIEDGAAATLIQAQAAGLPILTTANSSGPDLIEEGRNGWILPASSAAAFVEKLLWCDANRPALAAMAADAYAGPRSRDWAQVAEDFESLVASAQVMR